MRRRTSEFRANNGTANCGKGETIMSDGNYLAREHQNVDLAADFGQHGRETPWVVGAGKSL